MPIISSISISIGAALGFAATSFFVTATTFVLKTVVGLGINALLAKALKKDTPSYSVSGSIQTGGVVPRSFILGWRATAGSLVWANTWGNIGKTPNAYFTQVIALSDMPCSALTGIFVNGEKCTLLSGSEHVEFGIPVEEYRSNGVDYMWVKFFDGTQVAADSFLVNKAATTASPYEATRIGAGIAYVAWTCRINESLYTGFPQAKFEVMGMPLYDISKDTTRGGDGDHRIDNPATWGGDGDELLGVQAYNILNGIRYADKWLYGLQQSSAYNLPAAWWINQIEKCRDTFEGPDEIFYPNARTSIEIPVNSSPADALDAIIIGGNGRITESGGVYKLYVGMPEDPVGGINDDIVIATEDGQFTPFFTLDATVTGVEASYPEPEEAWNLKPATPIHDEDLEELAGDRRLPTQIEIGTVPYVYQVQKIMQEAIKEAGRERRHTLIVPGMFWIYEPGDVITYSSVDHGYESKRFRIDGVLDLDNLDVMWDLTEVDPDDFIHYPEEFTPPTYSPIGPVRPPTQSVTAFQVFPDSIDDNNGKPRRPTFGILFDGDLDDVRAVGFNVKLDGDPDEDLIATGEIPYGDPATNDDPKYVKVNNVFPPNTDLEVELAYIPYSGRPIQWSVWLKVKTPNIKMGAEDITVTLDLVSQAVAPLIANVRAQMESLKIRMDHMASQQMDAMGEQVKNDATVVRFQDVTAVAIREMSASIIEQGGEIVALASIVDAISVSVGDISADGLRRIDVQAGSGDVVARLVDMVRTSVEGEWVEAGTIIEVGFKDADPDQPFSNYILMGRKVLFMDDNGDVYALFGPDGLTIENVRLGTLRFDQLISNDDKMIISGGSEGTFIQVIA